MKKVLSLFLAVMMVLTLAVGCGRTTKTDSTPGNTAEASKADDKKPTTFSMYVCEVNPNADGFESPVAKEITKATGVKLDIEYAVSSDGGKQKLSLMAASGDYPDFVYGKGDLNIIKNANGIIKLDELIEKNAPNLKKFYGDSIKRIRWSKEDPSIYYVGGKEIGQENMEPNAGFQLQHAVMKELGYPKMKTLKDFEAAIKAYKDKYPTIDGQPSIGLSLLADDWRFLITVSNPACFATGGSDDGEWFVDQKSLSVVRHLLRPEEKEYFRWLNHMNAIGLLDPESFVQKYDQYKAKIATGRVIALADARWEFDEPVRALLKSGKEDRAYGFYPLTMDEKTKFADFMSTGYLGGWGIGITTKCKDPERAIRFFDWMCTEKAQILTHWGIEGEHYTVENGKRVMKPEVVKARDADPQFIKKTGIGNYVYPFPTYGNTVKDSTGQFYEPFTTAESIAARQTATENEVLKALGVKTWKELYPQSHDFATKPYGAAWLVNIEDPEMKAIDQKILQTGYKMIPAAILASPDKFDEMYDKYIKAIKEAGVDKITSYVEKRIKDTAELWK